MAARVLPMHGLEPGKQRLLMRYNRLGSSELRVSEIGLGTMTWGEQNTRGQAHAQIERALERGVNFIDAAEMYPVPARAETQGRTETYLGDWLAANPARRSELVVATKVAGRSQGLSWLRDGELPVVNREHIRRAAEASLRRLQIDTIDLYQIHWPDRYVPKFGETGFDPERDFEAVPIAEQLAALGELVAEGKVRYIGLSNETPYGVERFAALAEAEGLPYVASVQNAYSLVNRTFEMGLDEVCHRREVSLLPYSPLAFGLLTGKYEHGDAPAEARLNRFPGFAQRYGGENLAPAVSAYVELARRHGLSPAQMAIAFAKRQPYAASTIIGATSTEQLEENLSAADIEMSAELVGAIDDTHRRYPSPAP